MPSSIRTAFPATMLALMATAAAATPVHWSANGHYDEAISVPGGIPWQAA